MAINFKKLALGIVALGCTASFPTLAAPLNPTGWDAACDTEILADMEQRAWMMMQRELEANAFFIKKPDSVLELSCFDSQVGALANLGFWFSEQNIDGTSRTDVLNDAIDAAVQTAMETYLDGSFSYDSNGSRSGVSATGDYRLNGGYSSSTFSVTTGGSGSFDCTHMKRIWHDTACYNVQKTQLFDDMRLQKYGGDGADALAADRRDTLLWYTCHDAVDDTNDTWVERYVDTTEREDVEADPIVTNYLYTLPISGGSTSDPGGSGIDTGATVSCSGGICTTNTCQPPIPTGLTVVSNLRPKGFLDAVCPNPGCTIDFATADAGVSSASTDISDLQCKTAN